MGTRVVHTGAYKLIKLGIPTNMGKSMWVHFKKNLPLEYYHVVKPLGISYLYWWSNGKFTLHIRPARQLDPTLSSVFVVSWRSHALRIRPCCYLGLCNRVKAHLPLAIIGLSAENNSVITSRTRWMTKGERPFLFASVSQIYMNSILLTNAKQGNPITLD